MIAARLVLLALLSVGCSSSPVPDQAAGTEAALLAQEHAWTEAFKDRDSTMLNHVLAPDFVFTDDAGNVYSKDQYIRAVMELIQVTAYTVDDASVRIHGPTGVVIGRWSGTMSIGRQDASGAFRFTDTFVYRDGRWLVLASQDTRLPNPPTP